jgi:ATP-dependent DNA helicase 2 subunit 2
VSSERLTAGKYTVTMFLIDVSPSMSSMREVQVPSTAEGQGITIEMTNLEWSLQFVKMKIQEMVRVLT